MAQKTELSRNGQSRQQPQSPGDQQPAHPKGGKGKKVYTPQREGAPYPPFGQGVRPDPFTPERRKSQRSQREKNAQRGHSPKPHLPQGKNAGENTPHLVHQFPRQLGPKGKVAPAGGDHPAGDLRPRSHGPEDQPHPSQCGKGILGQKHRTMPQQPSPAQKMKQEPQPQQQPRKKGQSGQGPGIEGIVGQLGPGEAVPVQNSLSAVHPAGGRQKDHVVIQGLAVPHVLSQKERFPPLEYPADMVGPPLQRHSAAHHLRSAPEGVGQGGGDGRPLPVSRRRIAPMKKPGGPDKGAVAIEIQNAALGLAFSIPYPHIPFLPPEGQGWKLASSILHSPPLGFVHLGGGNTGFAPICLSPGRQFSRPLGHGRRPDPGAYGQQGKQRRTPAVLTPSHGPGPPPQWACWSSRSPGPPAEA